MAGFRVALAAVGVYAIAGCATLPEYRDDPLTTAEVIRHVKCEILDAAWLYPENKWVRAWTAGLVFEFEVSHTGGLDADNTWVFPLSGFGNPLFSVNLTGGFSGAGTRTERIDFKVPLSKRADADANLDCSGDQPGHKRLAGRLGIEDIFERAGLTMKEASVKSLRQLDYNLVYIIKKNSGLTPRFNLIPIGKGKTFTGQLKWTGSFSDTQTLKVTLTPPSDTCDYDDTHGCPAPMFMVVPKTKACSEFRTEAACKENHCRWVVHPEIDKCETPPASVKRMAPFARIPRALNRGISRADEERNTSAQTKNVLESIESELRRQRIGQ
jgi:hypothetical protein